MKVDGTLWRLCVARKDDGKLWKVIESNTNSMVSDGKLMGNYEM